MGAIIAALAGGFIWFYSGCFWRSRNDFQFILWSEKN